MSLSVCRTCLGLGIWEKACLVQGLVLAQSSCLHPVAQAPLNGLSAGCGPAPRIPTAGSRGLEVLSVRVWV